MYVREIKIKGILSGISRMISSFLLLFYEVLQSREFKF
jgi:hypothetical protein